MARRRPKRKSANGDFPTEPIVIALPAAIKARLKRKGLYRNRRVVRIVRVEYANGKLTIKKHKRGPKFVPSNSTFA